MKHMIALLLFCPLTLMAGGKSSKQKATTEGIYVKVALVTAKQDGGSTIISYDHENHYYDKKSKTDDVSKTPVGDRNHLNKITLVKAILDRYLKVATISCEVTLGDEGYLVNPEPFTLSFPGETQISLPNSASFIKATISYIND